MKAPFDPAKRGWRYPWHLVRFIGDYFDVPASEVENCRGVKNAAHSHGQLTTSAFRTMTLQDGTVRVMLVDTLADRHERQVTAVTSQTGETA